MFYKFYIIFYDFINNTKFFLFIDSIVSFEKIKKFKQ